MKGTESSNAGLACPFPSPPHTPCHPLPSLQLPPLMLMFPSVWLLADHHLLCYSPPPHIPPLPNPSPSPILLILLQNEVRFYLRDYS